MKPSFFQDEKLQELGPIHMLVFAGLWTQSDSKGRFQWRPKTLKLFILPFIDYSMDNVLSDLAANGYIKKYTVDGENYGLVVKFLQHQRISGKELESGEKHPGPEQGSTWEAPEKHPGVQELERERIIGKDIGAEAPSTPKAPRFQKPTLSEIQEYCDTRGNSVDAQKFLDHYIANGWRVGRNPMRDWRAAVRTWERNSGFGGYSKRSEDNGDAWAAAEIEASL